MGQRVFVVNKGKTDFRADAGSLLAGYYKGKWENLSKAKAEKQTGDVIYTLTNADDLILVGGKMETLGQATQYNVTCCMTADDRV